ncbi:GDP-D-glucose phosphorylase 1 isoform X2 [Colias croceus]|uniref:GDP-D-glucose phosphorylase 1 isoform X2 n=1 Tax=Colias crocea TaxID=72248 RepID=UPI001E27D60B|nr:GDP-D-glucose phosphorylase 1 isoform X2 [Colias croceus]
MFVFEDKSNKHSSHTFSFASRLKDIWEKIHTKTDVFRYKVDNLKQKIEGPYVFQFNPYRNAKRRPPEQIDDVCQAFDKNKFNFCKVSPEEVIFQFWRENKNDVHTILVNVSPINKYHSLLCPSVNKMLPQMITLESLQLVIDLYTMAGDRDLRIGFNSLCAMASVNHLHYHLFIVSQNLPVETVKCKNIKGPIWVIQYYPIPAFCFEITTSAIEMYKIIEYFFKKSIAHNIFVTRGRCFESDSETHRVLIWPRKSSSGAKQLTEMNAGVCELSGWFPVYSAEDYENIDIKSLEAELCKWKYEDFDQLCTDIELLY